MQSLANRQRVQAFTSGSKASRSTVVRCVASQPSRRDALLAGGLALVSPLVSIKSASAEEGTAKYAMRYLGVDNLSSFQKADQRTEFRVRAEEAIMKFLTPADAPACVRLALLDAGSYDIATKTGGATGAVILNPAALDSEAALKPLVEKLREAKKAIDEGDKLGSGPISWADLVYLAGKATTQASWREIKISRASLKSGGETIANNFSNPWPVVLGRIDSEASGPNKVPAADASVEEIKAYLLALGAKKSDGPFAPKAPFWEKPGFVIWTASAQDSAAEEARFAAYSSKYADIKKDYDVSRKTVTRTNYEMDFIDDFNKLTVLGAKLNPNAYLHPQAVMDAGF